MPTLPQQPSDVADILSASVKLYKESFTKIIGYSLIMFAFNSFLRFFMTDAIPVPDTTLSPDAQMEQQMEALSQALPSLLIVTGVAVLFACIFYGAVLYRIDNVARGRTDDFSEVLLQAVKKLPAVILAGILYTIAITIGSFLLVIPALILMISLAFSWYFILLEDKGVYDSLKTSHRLVWGDWWLTNLVFCVPVIVLSIVFTILIFLNGSFDPATDPASFSFNGLNVISDLLNTFITPYFIVLGYLQYHDLKLRKNM